MTSILEGVIKRGTGKKLRDLNVPLAGKTGTTNNNYDAWFIGFNSNLVIGVYIGYDNPQSLGKYETGSKAALPVFKHFVQNALYKDDFEEFKIPNGIHFAPINYNSGEREEFNNKKSIIEAFKLEDINKIKNNSVDKSSNYGKLVKFRQFY
jgi:penicillin-binding protein 1A